MDGPQEEAVDAHCGACGAACAAAAGAGEGRGVAAALGRPHEAGAAHIITGQVEAW